MKYPLLALVIFMMSFWGSCNFLAKEQTKKTGAVINALSSGNDSLRYSCYYLLLDSLKDGTYSGDDIKAFTDTINRDAAVLLAKAEKAQVKGADHRWIWSDMDYLANRDVLGVLLDILGYTYDREAIGILRKAMNLEDNSLKLFAALSLLKHDQFVPVRVIESIAADDETRLWLHKTLEECKKINLFPAQYNTQDLLAQSEMVQWLTYPTELGSVPDEIKLEQKLRIEKNGELMDFYLFKFRSSDTVWQQKGWMAGIAGGYIVKDEPTPYDQGETFSTFESWDSKTPEQHLSAVTELLDEARNKWNKEKETQGLSKAP